MIKASITLTEELALHMTQDELENYVLSSLSKNISHELVKSMTIEKTKDPLSGSITYVGSIMNTTPNTVTISTAQGYNGTNSSYSQINLRVVEYTKAGKITRVELQRCDENGEWMKIPRLQIEE